MLDKSKLRLGGLCRDTRDFAKLIFKFTVDVDNTFQQNLYVHEWAHGGQRESRSIYAAMRFWKHDL